MNKLKIIIKKNNDLADNVWSLVRFWSPFNQTIVGNKFIQCLDNVSLNIGLALNKKDTDQKKYLQKVYNCIIEAAIYNDIARRRKLLGKEDYQAIYVELSNIKKILKSN